MSREYKKAECLFCKQVKVIAAKGYCRACYSRLQKTGSMEYKKIGKRIVCSVNDCDKFSVSHGLCDKHRQRLKKHGHTTQTRPNDWGKREGHPLYGVWVNIKRFKSMQVCVEWKNDFWRFVDDVKERPSIKHKFKVIDENAIIDKHNYEWVKRESTTPEERKKFLRDWARQDRKNNPDKYKDRQLKKSFGIGLDDYNRMLEIQGGVCDICGNPEKTINPRTKEPFSLAVDHCHETGKVRSLLCRSCNKGIGHFKDNSELLQEAIVYLNKHK